MKTMRAVLLNEPVKARDMVLTECEVPEVRPGWVLVRVRAFGLNHSERLLREAEISAPYIQKPIIPGIECVGEIADASDSRFTAGQRVIALMGGMGRSFNGSYAEYALLPETQVFSVRTDLPWERLAAVPETYFTAWGSLFDSLRLQPEDTLWIRGGTCALGYAAIQLAKAFGCTITATSHRPGKLALLKEAGADFAVLDTGTIRGTSVDATKVLELVGPKTLRDSLFCVKKGGVVCHTGVLGGQYTLNGFDPIKEIPNGVYLTGFFSNSPDQQTIDDIFNFLDGNRLSPCLGRVHNFSQIARACEDMDCGKVNGKIVVRVDT